MLHVLVEVDVFVQRIVYAVDAHAHIPRALIRFELLYILPFPAAHDGSDDLQFRSAAGHYFVRNLVHGLPDDFPAAFRTMRHADARVKQTHIVVYLRHRAHGGTRVVRSGFLVDGNGGREPLDVFDVRFLHLSEELTRIAGQALHISALSFRENGVECKRRFSAARKPRKHHEFVARDFEVDVFQIVFLCAFDEYLFHFPICRRRPCRGLISVSLSVFSVRSFRRGV